LCDKNKNIFHTGCVKNSFSLSRSIFPRDEQPASHTRLGSEVEVAEENVKVINVSLKTFLVVEKMKEDATPIELFCVSQFAGCRVVDVRSKGLIGESEVVCIEYRRSRGTLMS